MDKLSKDNAGISVKELLEERVLIKAKRQLAFSQYSIADIAAQLGIKAEVVFCLNPLFKKENSDNL